MRYRLRTLLILLLLWPLIAFGQDMAATELDKTTQLDCKDLPLRDVAVFLSDQHGVSFVLGPDVKGDTPITCKVKDIKLRAALDSILGPLKLRFRAVAGTILIEPLANK